MFLPHRRPRTDARPRARLSSRRPRVCTHALEVHGRGPSRRGVILIIVLVVIALLALASLSFSELMLAERRAAQVSGEQVQVRFLAESGAELARHFVDRAPELQDSEGGWYDNPGQFQGVLAIEGEPPLGCGRFTILAPRLEDRAAAGLRYGLEDESARINLATLLDLDKTKSGTARELLMKLPAMTDQIADAILDWLDSDDNARENGAEQEYYSSLVPAYAPRNGPPLSIEELLLVRDVTPALLFGADTNRNGRIDGSESRSPTLEGVDNSDGSMTCGWAAYFTLYSAEHNRRPDGTPKIDLTSDAEKLREQLGEVLEADWVKFIVAYRKNGPYRGSTPGKPASKPSGSSTITSVLDLIGVRTQAEDPKDKGQEPATDSKDKGPNDAAADAKPEILDSPFTDSPSAMRSYLPKLLDEVTVGSEEIVRGRININQAPRAVLMCIPGMTPDAVDQIIARRVMDPSQADPSQRYATWILCEGYVSLETMKALMPLVTAGGHVYRVQATGYFDGGGPTAALEAVFDATKPPARVVSWKYATTSRAPVEQQ